MGQLLSSIFYKSTNELNLTLHRIYDTRYYHLTSIKLQPHGSLFAVANESGTLLVYDYLSNTDDPQQFKIFGYEYGGVCELLWISQDLLAVGTTRGVVVILSFKINKRHAVEVCRVNAHGDGAIQVAVQCLDYCPYTRRLVSIGQGVASIRLWTVSEHGKLESFPGSEKSPTAYSEPRFVSLIAQGTQVLVGFLENATVQRYSIENWVLIDEFILGQVKGATDNRQLGNGILMKENMFALHNLRDGVDIFDPKANFALLGSARFEITHCCSQGLSTLQNGKFFICPSTRGNIYIYRSYDCKIVSKLRVPGRHSQVKAIHSISILGDQNIVIATSYSETKPTKISVWTDGTRRSAANNSRQSREFSRLQMVVLCILICILCQMTLHTIPVVFPPSPYQFKPRKSTSIDSSLNRGSMRKAHVFYSPAPPQASSSKPTNVDCKLPVGIQSQTVRDTSTSIPNLALTLRPVVVI